MIFDDFRWFSMMLDAFRWLRWCSLDFRGFSMMIDDVWWLLMIFDDCRWFQRSLGDFLKFSIIFYDSWLVSMIFKDYRWFSMILNDVWWFPMIFNGFRLVCRQIVQKSNGEPFYISFIMKVVSKLSAKLSTTEKNEKSHKINVSPISSQFNFLPVHFSFMKVKCEIIIILGVFFLWLS